MNERIKQIAEECGLYIAYDNRDVTNKELEYFAELIVKECASVQHKRFCEHGDVSWDILMEHFGIEE